MGAACEGTWRLRQRLMGRKVGCAQPMLRKAKRVAGCVRELRNIAAEVALVEARPRRWSRRSPSGRDGGAGKDDGPVIGWHRGWSRDGSVGCDPCGIWSCRSRLASAGRTCGGRYRARSDPCRVSRTSPCRAGGCRQSDSRVRTRPGPSCKAGRGAGANEVTAQQGETAHPTAHYASIRHPFRIAFRPRNRGTHDLVPEWTCKGWVK